MSSEGWACGRRPQEGSPTGQRLQLPQTLGAERSHPQASGRGQPLSGSHDWDPESLAGRGELGALSTEDGWPKVTTPLEGSPGCPGPHLCRPPGAEG